MKLGDLDDVQGKQDKEQSSWERKASQTCVKTSNAAKHTNSYAKDAHIANTRLPYDCPTHLHMLASSKWYIGLFCGLKVSNGYVHLHWVKLIQLHRPWDTLGMDKEGRSHDYHMTLCHNNTTKTIIFTAVVKISGKVLLSHPISNQLLLIRPFKQWKTNVGNGTKWQPACRLLFTKVTNSRLWISLAIAQQSSILTCAYYISQRGKEGIVL